jgi:hypothetical protein
MMLVAVEGPSLKLTSPVVLNVMGAFAVGNVRRSDLMKPIVPFILTLDQPAGSCSRRRTFVPGSTVLIMFESVSVEAEDLKLTLPVV